jgi:DNA-binding MarR family transcriptional regulator
MERHYQDHVDAVHDQWRRERPDLDVQALATVGRILRAAHLLNGALAEGLAAYELQPGWFDLLAALRRAGAPYALNPSELMRATLLSSGGMTKRLDRLEEAGLIERRPDPDDRRGTRVRLTRRGKATIDRALGTHVANEELLLADFSPAERAELDRLLRRLLVRLERA